MCKSLICLTDCLFQSTRRNIFLVQVAFSDIFLYFLKQTVTTNCLIQISLFSQSIMCSGGRTTQILHLLEVKVAIL